MVQLVQTDTFRRPGRPMKLGKIVKDPLTGSIGVNAGPCHNCHLARVLTREDARELANMFAHESRSLTVLLLDFLLHRRRL